MCRGLDGVHEYLLYVGLFVEEVYVPLDCLCTVFIQ